MMRNYRLYHLLLVGALAYVSAALSILWIQLTISPPPGAPPVEWLAVDPWPTEPLCPGDSVNYATVIRINEPGGLYIYTATRRAGNHPAIEAARLDPDVQAVLQDARLPLAGDTVIPARADSIFRTGFMDDEVPTVIVDLDNLFVVPDLPPGMYDRISVAGLDGRNNRATTRRQTFEIGEGCP